MTELEAWITGMLLGSIMKIQTDGTLLVSQVEPVMDREGNYTNQIRIHLESGAELMVTVNQTV